MRESDCTWSSCNGSQRRAERRARGGGISPHKKVEGTAAGQSELAGVAP